jgi:hypothetical protein
LLVLTFVVIGFTIFICRGHNYDLRVERQKDSQQERWRSHQDEQRRCIPGMRQTAQQCYSKAERHWYGNNVTLQS